MTEILVNTIIISIAIPTISVTLYLLFSYIFSRRRKLYPRVKYRIKLRELYDTVDLIIATEIATYEKYLGNSTQNDLDSPLTNSQFINIYDDLCKRILTGLSPTFYEMVSVYMTEDAMNTYITQRIYNYLADRVANSDSSIREGVGEDET